MSYSATSSGKTPTIYARSGGGAICTSRLEETQGHNTALSRTGENNVLFDIQLPGNEFSILPEVNGKISEGGVEASRAGESYLWVSKDARLSGFAVQIGKSASDEAPSYSVILRGPPSLFPMLDIPQNLPPVAAYSEATIHFYDSTAKIDTIHTCAPESSGSRKSSAELAALPPTQSAASNTQTLEELLIVPRCFQLSGFSWEKAGMTSRFTARITLGGVVGKLMRAEQIGMYDILVPGNEVAIVDDINGTQSPDRFSSSRRAGATLTLKNMKDSSSLIVQIHGLDRDLIVLKGPPGLFPTADIPEALPPLSAYTEATVRGVKVDMIGVCGTEPLVSFNNGIIRSRAPSGSAASSEPPKENAPTVTPPDPKATLSRQVLSLALQGNYQGIFKYLALTLTRPR